MPNIDLSNVQESKGGSGSYTLEPGAYVMTIIDYEIQNARQYVRLRFDVAEGPRKGTYANAQWPISDVMSWKDAAKPMLKQKLRVLTESNPGWDAYDAFTNDRWGEFLGKVVGAVVRTRLYTKKDGTDGEGCEIYQLCTIEQVASGDFVVPGPKDDRKGWRDEDAAPNPPTAAAMPAPQYPQYQPQPHQYPQQMPPQQYQPQMPPQYPQPPQYQPQPQQYQQPAMEPVPWEQ